MRWRNAGMVPQTVFGLEYYIFIPVIPWLLLVIHGWIWTVFLLLWFVFMFVLNKIYGLRLLDVFTLISRFMQGDWRIR